MAKTILDHAEVDRLIALALEEDGVENDLTSLATGLESRSDKIVRASIVAKKSTIAAGYPILEKILKLARADQSLRVSSLAAEGASLAANTQWIIFEGRAIDLLRLERTILNFLMRMSGIATATNAAVAAVQGTHCKILHTRKTAPGHRRTDVYAALAAGAHPHRRSLDDAILVKENHLRAANSFQELIEGIQKLRDKASFVEIEVTDFTELKHALMAKPDRIMLDNFSARDVERAVNLFGSSVQLEASGSINLSNVRQYAETGVDFISMGYLTHSAPSADLSMLFDIP
ncbi:MAG: carboxylating nicotinate-nucleotide diphosphorylase [Bdellovibrionota bacterium]